MAGIGCEHNKLNTMTHDVGCRRESEKKSNEANAGQSHMASAFSVGFVVCRMTRYQRGGGNYLGGILFSVSEVHSGKCVRC